MEPFARELMERARQAHDPTPQDRARVRGKLEARIAAGAVLAGASAKGMGLGWSAIVKGVLVLSLGATGAYILVHRSDPPRLKPDPAPIAETITPPPVTPPIVTVEATAETAPPVPSVRPAPPVHSALPAAPAGVGDIEAETVLITEAQAATQRGDFASAFAKLDEHEKSFPNGVLTQERIAARIVALCGAGRQPEARALAKTFLSRYPTSPLAPRVKSSCAAP